MKRRKFLLDTPIAATGLILANRMPSFARETAADSVVRTKGLYDIFRSPDAAYRPFVRWWWNGDKVEKKEISRELRLLKDAGIGGVEINPIRFPLTEDIVNIPALTWLSPAWIEMVDFALTEARSLGLTADIIVGSGWPFGAEYLKGDDRSQVMVVSAHALKGPLHYEVSQFELLKETDPPITSPFPGRKMELVCVRLVPARLERLEQARDLSGQIPSGSIVCEVPEGDYYLYAQVRIEGFQQVINGAPGAGGPVLNHYNAPAVTRFLNRMTDTIEQQVGPLAGRIRSLFTDSLELEGANWCQDMEAEFLKRRGYELGPYLMFILYPIGSMGNTYDYRFGAETGEQLTDRLRRIRYDFDLTCSELLTERFYEPFCAWCRSSKVKSRIQAYGRGYQPLEGSFGCDIPECETWVQKGLGTEMSDHDTRRGRAYTVVNKFVSSAAHLEGKRLISCEELTNIYRVFTTTLEMCKVVADQSILSGTTQPVFHGFGYSPPEAPFPGWVRYGTFLNERNPWWPYFKLFTGYKARLSAFLQQGDLFADIALLAPTADLWSRYGAQNNPFPFTIYPDYQPLVWEAVHRGGNGCDYVSEAVIRAAEVRNGRLHYGPRSYHSLFLIGVSSLEPPTARKLSELVSAGGRVFCLDTVPGRSPGWHDHDAKDAEVKKWVEKMRRTPERFVQLPVPADRDFTTWFAGMQKRYHLTPYLTIEGADTFVNQVRYRFGEADALFIVNSDVRKGRRLRITPAEEITRGRHPWVWDAHTGNRYRLPGQAGTLTLSLSPADSRLIIFDQQRSGPRWQPLPEPGKPSYRPAAWDVTFRHINGQHEEKHFDKLPDIEDTGNLRGFAGTLVYRTTLPAAATAGVRYLNLGRVAGVSEVRVGGREAGSRWYGDHRYDLKDFLAPGDNLLEVRVITILGNYLKTLEDNVVGQYWTNEGSKVQPFQQVGLLGPVTLYG